MCRIGKSGRKQRPLSSGNGGLFLAFGSQLSHAGLAYELTLIRNNVAGIAAENAGRMILFQNDAVILHENFDHILKIDIHRSAQFNGENDPSEGIELANDTG